MSRDPRPVDASRAPRQGGGEIEVVARGGQSGLHHDEAVVFKPAGLSSERSAGNGSVNDAGDSLATRVQAQFGWDGCWLPHRLDRPTRGLMVVCGSSEAAARCSEELREAAWTKWYFARVPIEPELRGTPISTAAGLVGPHKAYLKRVGRLAVSVRSGGDPSRLEVLAVEPSTDDPRSAHALIRLDTGRFHQIRVMLATLGFPLIGDSDYRNEKGTPRIDLEAVALRMQRGSTADAAAYVHRIPTHPARRGVSSRLEDALDAVLSAG